MAARRARLMRRSAWTPHRSPPLPKGRSRHVEDVAVVTDGDEAARHDAPTGVENADGRLDATKTARQSTIGKIDITETIYVAGRGRPLTMVAGAGFEPA